MDAGWFVPAIRPPTVASGTARLRFTVTVGHIKEQIQQVLASVSALIGPAHTKCRAT